MKNQGSSLNKGFKGEGTKSNPFLIETEKDLIHIEKYMDKGYFFKQINDITLTSNWDTLGNEEKSFKGNYDGNNKSILNLTNALFFKIEESTVENLSLKEIQVDVELEKVGSIANISIDSCVKNCNISGDIITRGCSISCEGGMVVGNMKKGSIENCSAKGSITVINTFSTGGSYHYSYGGGIVGWVNGGKIQSCSVDANIVAKTTSPRPCSSYAGGIVGAITGGNIENCNVNSNLDVIKYPSSPCSSYGGGIAGALSEGGIIENCNISGVINFFSSSSLYGGGVVGTVTTGSIKSSTTKVELTNSSGYLKGKGIAAELNIESVFSNNYVNNTSVIDKIKINSNDENSSGGKLLDLNKFDEKFYKTLGWDFEKIWIWNSDRNVPVLRNIC